MCIHKCDKVKLQYPDTLTSIVYTKVQNIHGKIRLVGQINHVECDVKMWIRISVQQFPLL